MRSADGATLSMAEFRALQDVKNARTMLDKALASWWEPTTFDTLHDATELLKRACWRIGTFDE